VIKLPFALIVLCAVRSIQTICCRAEYHTNCVQRPTAETRAKVDSDGRHDDDIPTMGMSSFVDA
jgi:hypothetical protein